MTKTKFKKILRGAWRSVTMYFGAVVVALGGLEQYNGILTLWIGDKYAGLCIMVFGVLAIILRIKTKTSLEERGALK